MIAPDPRRVFVIHGRNAQARRGIFDFLRSIGLTPIEWSEALQMTGAGSPYIGEVLDHAFEAAQAILVLETPDDIAYLHPSLTSDGDPETDPQPQPRPNVLFEAGMAIGRDARRTVIVELGQVKMFSDIHGRHVVRLDNSVPKRQDLAQRLRTAGCAVNLDGTDWYDAGDLTPPPPPGGGLPLGRRLPATKASGTPRLAARYLDRGSKQGGEVELTNHGPGDLLEVNVAPKDVDDIVHLADDLPIPRLPYGGSVRVMRIFQTYDSRSASYFYMTVTGRTADGITVEDELFVSGL